VMVMRMRMTANARPHWRRAGDVRYVN